MTVNELQVTSGIVERTWRLTQSGLVTTRVANVVTGQEWTGKTLLPADWALPIADEQHPHDCPAVASLVDVQVQVSDDEGFTTEHLEVAVVFRYPDHHLEVRLLVWVWPDAPGLRTQVQARATPGFVSRDEGDKAWPRTGMVRCDAVPVTFTEGVRRRCIGLHGDTQNRNDTDLDLLLERVRTRPVGDGDVCTWANICTAETDAGGLALVKESHKFINQFGHDGGIFRYDSATGLHNLGWGLLAGELTGEFLPAWASWCIVYGPGDVARHRAFKQFDRTRYPIDPRRDAYVQANTWGSSYGRMEHRDAAGEAAVLREIESCADLGIDVLQIDDGWQGNDYKSWTPDPTRYPEGWGPVRRRAAALGVKLGLWASCRDVSLEDLLANNSAGGFVSYKLDFAHLGSRASIESLMGMARNLCKQSDHPVRVNWDLTEVAARFGYFFAREYGQIYLENRKPLVPRSAVYCPHTVLRDLWQIATYLPLQKFQGTIQNPDRIDRVLSDAWRHPHDYCVAIALMSTPLFFQQTQFYSDDARAQIRPLLAIYKQHRERIFASDVSPIGAQPDNAAWTGFQAHDPATGSGYVLVFRELYCGSETTSLPLPGLADGTYVVEDLHDRYVGTAAAILHGSLNVDIPQAPGFRFLRYWQGT